VNHWHPEVVYPNFVYTPILGGIDEPIRISSDVNELAAHCRQVNKEPLKKDNSVFLKEMVITSTEV